eukprot:CAMPEP_0198143060 /NCGR_PEP_ID=MMETSP1443-20131203/5674_1 /TAXON_ID=186043 /ORGANISM="Entomoneis sp., Strain CCMP2396" /LENGTH=353 /DNA_ID=CAMNT_0043806199 /DNA_START=17 /DNA_END=1078 /DNA_ORIENTATION=-
MKVRTVAATTLLVTAALLLGRQQLYLGHIFGDLTDSLWPGLLPSELDRQPNNSRICKAPLNSSSGLKIAVCSFGKNEDAYIDEWVDYNLGIGFSTLYIYDNTDRHELQQWGEERAKHSIFVTSFPGHKKQSSAYHSCAVRAKKEGHDWVFFNDFDEYLVLKSHRHVADFLQDYGRNSSVGAIGISWRVVGDSGKQHYEPFPVSKRFQMMADRRYRRNMYIKSIVKLEGMNLDLPVFDPHVFHLKPSFKMINTDGIAFTGSLLFDFGPDNVASIYHYYYKSRQEHVAKRTRGGGTLGVDHALLHKATMGLDAFNNTIPHGKTFDDTVWETLKNNCPKYALYDELYPTHRGKSEV